jgi:alkaline phosphatase
LELPTCSANILDFQSFNKNKKAKNIILPSDGMSTILNMTDLFLNRKGEVTGQLYKDNKVSS